MKKSNNEFLKRRPINYLTKDFGAYKENLLELAKTYYPTSYKDFSEGSTGMMFMDMMAYVGDVLSYYTDAQFNESFLTNAVERENIIAAAKFLGYTPSLSIPATGEISVFQVIPSIRDSSGEFVPDNRFALSILPGMQVSTTNQNFYITSQTVDFSVNTQESPAEISVFSRNASDEIDTFLVKKKVGIQSGVVKTQVVDVGAAKEFFRVVLNSDDALEVLKVTDSDGNRWYEVDWLAQDIVFTETHNISTTEQSLSRFNDSVPYILGSLRTSRKFITGVNSDSMYIEFGSGVNVDFEDEVISSIKRVSSERSKIDMAIDPSTFLQGRSYGEVPTNTTLTIEYIEGGGISSNVGSGEITEINRISYSDKLDGLSQTESGLISSLQDSIRVVNEDAITGGRNSESDEEIRQNALAHFNSQNRVVSKEDYLVRCLSMPSKFGRVAKAFVASEDQLQFQSTSPFAEKDRSFSVNIFTLAYDSNKKLVSPNKALMANLEKYLHKNRILTDDITLRIGNVINIGVDFEIITFKGENKQSALFDCIEAIKNFLDIDNMDFNQPINLSLLELELANIDSVQSVSKLEIKNLTSVDGDYSPNRYSIITATKNKILYPSLDPSIFEVKFPDRDIKGRCL